jgi:hypothetical protein
MDHNTNHRTDAEHIRKKNVDKNIWPNTSGEALASQMEQRVVHPIQRPKYSGRQKLED